MASYFPEKFPIHRKLKARGISPDPDASEHDSTIWDMQSAHAGVKKLREEFKAALAEADKRFKAGYLGERGLVEAKERIIEEHTEKLEKFRSAETAGRKAEQQYRAELRPKKPKSADMDEAVEAGWRRHRTITRYEILPAEQRRAALRVALEKSDHNFLSLLLAEPALLDEESARRIEIEVMKAGDRKKFGQLEELTGRHDYAGKPDPLTGALPVLSYAIDSTRDWFRSEAGLGAAPAELKIDDGAIVLSEGEARDPNTFRQARDQAQEQGLELRIENGEDKG